MTPMLDFADKDFKADTITAQGYLENMLIMNKMKSSVEKNSHKELNINSTNQKCNI